MLFRFIFEAKVIGNDILRPMAMGLLKPHGRIKRLLHLRQELIGFACPTNDAQHVCSAIAYRPGELRPRQLAPLPLFKLFLLLVALLFARTASVDDLEWHRLLLR
jgi:hypothetical protein